MTQPWLPDELNEYSDNILRQLDLASTPALLDRIDNLVKQNRRIHLQECINLDPATNIMNPRAEALLSSGLGTRPSLGHVGDKYEMGLEAIEQIEVIASSLAREIFGAQFAEIRVGSGSLANLYVFMATCKPGSVIIAPPPAIGGHVTHHRAGAAGLFGLQIHHAPIDRHRYTVDLDGLRQQARKLRPALITIGGSLNLLPHPVAAIRDIADEVGARVLFDAAHQCGLIAGKYWPNPLDNGAHLMTMSTYKSLGGPPGGLIVSNDAGLMEHIDAIAFPGLTANFDVAKSAALAVTLLDWREHGAAYARGMVETAQALALSLQGQGMPLFSVTDGGKELTGDSHQFAIEAQLFGGGQRAARLLRSANLLSCGIGLPIEPVEGDVNGLRLGSPEIVRSGMNTTHMEELARHLADCLLQRRGQSAIAADVTALRQQFEGVRFICD